MGLPSPPSSALLAEVAAVVAAVRLVLAVTMVAAATERAQRRIGALWLQILAYAEQQAACAVAFPRVMLL